MLVYSRGVVSLLRVESPKGELGADFANDPRGTLNVIPFVVANCSRVPSNVGVVIIHAVDGVLDKILADLGEESATDGRNCENASQFHRMLTGFQKAMEARPPMAAWTAAVTTEAKTLIAGPAITATAGLTRFCKACVSWPSGAGSTTNVPSSCFFPVRDTTAREGGVSARS